MGISNEFQEIPVSEHISFCLGPFKDTDSWGFPGGPVVKNCLAMQQTSVLSLVWEDPTCCGATKPVRHNYRAKALEPTNHNY